jgi:BirA family biotin operon repressor/biotin-[acetyl-CoA-carboxylase] ligase
MFNIEKFDIKLDTEQIGRSFILCDEVDSTNTYLMKDKNITLNGTVILAERQTKGKGRLARTWFSGKGLNLTFSVLLNRKKLFKNPGLANLTTAVSLGTAIENLYQLKTELKWPNDVLINQKKVAGILIESAIQGPAISKMVIGIGMNVNQAVFHGEFRIEPTSIRNELGQNVEREKFLSEFFNIYEEYLETSIKKPEFILKEWRERCRMMGESITVTHGKGVKYGIFEDIDERGSLILRLKTRKEKIHFGDVSVS